MGGQALARGLPFYLYLERLGLLRMGLAGPGKAWHGTARHGKARVILPFYLLLLY